MSAKKQRLSLCMIAKNAEEMLPKCLDSVKSLVDEIVIAIDDSTNDKTEMMAKQYGAKTTKFSWTFDFSEIRNLALQHATGEWILVLDASESISKNDLKKIDIAINDKNADAYYLLAPNPVVRLFRNNKEYRFRNPIYETMEESIAENNGKIKNLFISIEKHGSTVYTANLSGFLQHSLEQIKKMPNDPKHYFDAGMIYEKMEDLDKALEMFDKVSEIDPKYRNVFAKMGNIFLGKEHYKRALQCYQKHLDENSKDASVHVSLGILHAKTGDYENAEKSLKKAVELNPESLMAYDNLIAMFLQKNEFDRAAKAAHLAYKITKIPKYGETVLFISKMYEKQKMNQQ